MLPAIILLLAVALAAAGCHNGRAAGQPAADRAKLPVFAGIPPVAYLVQRIGGRHVEVGMLVQPGQNPHIFEPSPRQVVALKGRSCSLRSACPLKTRLSS